MEKRIAQFLEFNGRRINVLTADGQWWVAIKPICEALSIDFEAQRKNLKNDEILGQLPSNQTVVAADGKAREMLCLPEKYVYGWLFSIRSDSNVLADYKRKCYDVLYNHFHAPLTGRMTSLNEKSAIDLKIEELENKMLDSAEYREIQELKKRKTAINAKLRQLDKELIAGQLSMDLQ